MYTDEKNKYMPRLKIHLPSRHVTTKVYGPWDKIYMPRARLNVEPCHSLMLNHWGWVKHIIIGKLTIIDSDNGLSPGRRQAIICTNSGILLIGPQGTNFKELWSKIQTFSLKKMHFKMSSAKWQTFCPGLNVLSHPYSMPNTMRQSSILYLLMSLSQKLILVSQWNQYSETGKV